MRRDLSRARCIATARSRTTHSGAAAEKAVPPDARFVYHRDPETGVGHVDELVDESPHGLVAAESAQAAVAELLHRMLDLTYGHLVKGSEEAARSKLDPFASAADTTTMETNR